MEKRANANPVVGEYPRLVIERPPLAAEWPFFVAEEGQQRPLKIIQSLPPLLLILLLLLPLLLSQTLPPILMLLLVLLLLRLPLLL